MQTNKLTAVSLCPNAQVNDLGTVGCCSAASPEPTVCHCLILAFVQLLYMFVNEKPLFLLLLLLLLLLLSISLLHSLQSTHSRASPLSSLPGFPTQPWLFLIRITASVEPTPSTSSTPTTMPHSPYQRAVYPVINDLEEYGKFLARRRVNFENGTLDGEKKRRLLKVADTLLQQCEFLEEKLKRKVSMPLVQ